MKFAMYMWIFVSSVLLVHADTFYDDEALTIDEFLNVNETELGNFNSTLLGYEELYNNHVYYFDMNVYMDYWDVENSTGEELPVLMVVPVRMTFTWDCYETYSCSTLFDEFLGEFKNWTLQYYTDLKSDYE